MRTRKVLTMLTVFVTAVVVVEGQQRPLSPRGQSSTQVGGSYNAQGRYQGGHWIDIDYGRPILRGRENIFGEGDEFGQRIYAGAPIWRIGADPSTRFSTEVDLVFGGQRLPAGEYGVNSTGRRNTSMMRCCNAETETEKVRPGGSACDAFAWSAAGNGACGAATVLEGDRAGAVE